METAATILDEIAFRNSARARKDLASLTPLLSPAQGQPLQVLLRQVPDPDQVLNYLQRLVVSYQQPASNVFQPASRLHAVGVLFAHSHFLAETLFRYPEVLDWALDEQNLYRVLSRDDLRTDLGWTSISTPEQEVARIFARFKRMHLLRIALRDLLGIATLAEVTLELSNLADAILQGAQDYAYEKLASRFGRPLTEGDSGPIECQLTVLALGKLGGQELNYSSDIDLIFLFTDEGQTSGPIRISNKEFSIALANLLTQLISQATRDGFSYRVDLRLRPEGTAGEIVTSLRTGVEYYHRRARDWELQALIKARPSAGSARLGNAFLEMIAPLIYQTSTDFSMIERVSETRDRIQEKLERRRHRRLDVKLARGGIRDIEFLVQCMQRLHGGKDPWVRSGGTLFALHRLRDKRYLSMLDYARLNSAYHYLRLLEHRLQLEDNRQTHVLPDSPADMDVLARKMHDAHSAQAASSGLLEHVEQHLKDVMEIYERVVHTQAPAEESPASAERVLEAPSAEPRPEPPTDPSWKTQVRHIEKLSPELARLIKTLPIRWGRKHFRHFLNKVVSMRPVLAEFEQSPPLLRCAADLIEHSPFLAEQLIRCPEDIALLKSVAARDTHGPEETITGAEEQDRGEMQSLLEGEGDFHEKSNRLRRFYRHQMLRILAESICCRHPIFSTLGKTTRLADWVIQTAYEISLQEVCSSSNWSRPKANMLVIGLGRLGIGEFDLGSDADLVFVLPDEEMPNRHHWTHVVERLVEMTSSYTREGRIFTVDARLRPMGRDGELGQSESNYVDYFGKRAEAWEAITYMKSRTITGDFERGAEFLIRLQDVDWRRFGLSEDLAGLLVKMRERLEREQGQSHPIKAAWGGYYDIDFILMYLRLREAGIFFESLNTPERIDVIQATGGLRSEQASLLRDTAVFFRSLDHAIRIMNGQATPKIPSSPAQQEVAKELISRWSAAEIGSEPLPAYVDRARRTTRDLFNQIFGRTSADGC